MSLPGSGEDRLCAAHKFHVFFACFYPGQGIEIGGVAFKPTEMFLVHGLCIMAHRAVTTPVVPLLRERVRNFHHLGNLEHGMTLVGEPQCLVVDILVNVGLFLKPGVDIPVVPAGPVAADEDHVRPVAEEPDCFVQEMAPCLGVAHLGSSQRVEVVQGVSAVLRHAERPELRKIEVHLGGRLGAGRVLEDDPDAVDGPLFPGPAYAVVRNDQCLGAGREGLAKACVYLPLWSLGQQVAVHVVGSSAHGIACHDLLLRHDPLHAKSAHIGHDSYLPSISAGPFLLSTCQVSCRKEDNNKDNGQNIPGLSHHAPATRT